MTASPADLNRIVGAILALAVAFTLGFVVRSQLPVEREPSETLEAAAIEALRQVAEQGRAPARGVLRVSGSPRSPLFPADTRPVKVRDVKPEYTEHARAARIQGVVILRTLIDDEGNVVNIEILKELPMGLSEAAVDAVKQWKFEPATLDGQPVPANHNVTVNFKLS